MRKHRSVIFMLTVTVLVALLCGLIGWVACQVDEPKAYDQHQMNGACRYQAVKYLNEKEN